jgi:hypothetical protein
MSLSNPLPATWHVALCAKDALELTRRVLERSPSHPQAECKEALEVFQLGLRKGTHYEVPEALSFLVKKGKPSQEVDEIEGLLVLDLWATFERFLRDYLQEKGTVLKQYIQPLPFADSSLDSFA